MPKLAAYGVVAFLLNCCVLAPAQAETIVEVDSRDLYLNFAPDDYPYGQGLSAWQDLKSNPGGISDLNAAATAGPDLAYGGDFYAEPPYQVAVLLTDFYRLDYDAVIHGFGDRARALSVSVMPGLYDLVVAAVGRTAAVRLTGNLSDSSYHDFSETFGFAPIDPFPDPLPEPSSIIVLASGLLAIYRKLQR